MKKILLLSTMIVGTAGMAAADLRLSGGARFGVLYDGSGTNAAGVAVDSETMVTNRFTLNIDGTAEADNGLSFFARVRIRGDNTNTGDGIPNNSNVSAPRIGVTYGSFTVAVGNILGALESTPGLYDGAVGLTGLGWNNLPTNAAEIGKFRWDSFSSGGAGANGIEAIYSGGAFTGHISFSANDVVSPTVDRLAINVAYSFGDWTVALAHQDGFADADTMTLVTVAGSFGDFGVGLAYSDNDGKNSATRINGSYTFGGGTTVTAFATIVGSGAVLASGDSMSDAYGLGFTHSLGGATLAGGVARGFDDRTVADFGVRFNF